MFNQAEGKKKAKRKKKDANAPKRASSAYMIWMGANRSRIVAANPGIKVLLLWWFVRGMRDCASVLGRVMGCAARCRCAAAGDPLMALCVCFR